MQRRRLISLGIAGCLSAMSLAACAGGSDDSGGSDSSGSNKETITIGNLAMETGPGATAPGPFTLGLELGVDEVNASGLLDDVGVTLKLQSEDTASEPTQSVTVYNRLVRSGAIVVTSPGFTPVAQAVTPTRTGRRSRWSPELVRARLRRTSSSTSPTS
ncbi:MAG TPA: ABC transporter substrate-binding protein [Propionibacteriaceae bacterium]|nr:ABC transporter substrate-binding protein [Propionibacteriaceae bacterium]